MRTQYIIDAALPAGAGITKVPDNVRVEPHADALLDRRLLRPALAAHALEGFDDVGNDFHRRAEVFEILLRQLADFTIRVSQRRKASRKSPDIFSVHVHWLSSKI